jgi:hypothetical protein
VDENPFLQWKSNDFSKNNLNDIEVHTFFHFQVHTTIIYTLKKTSESMGLEKINFDIKLDFKNLKFSF